MSKKKEETTKSKSTVVMGCTCHNAYQNSTYGHGKRVHNVGPKSGATCTVCGSKKK